MGTLVQRVLATCPGNVGGIVFVGGGSGAAELAMANGTQQVAPMARPLGTLACGTGPLNSFQTTSEGLEIAAEVVMAVASATASAQCQGQKPTGGLASTSTITVQNPSAPDTVYRFSDWKDVLGVLYTGRDRAHVGVADCGSNLRRSLQKSWFKMFQGTCSSGPCADLKHLWRPSDLSGTTQAFLALASLPGVPVGAVKSTPFCNGTESEDNDPIRVPCAANDNVCGADGSSGLVQAIAVPSGVAASIAYPTRDCEAGVYDWVPAPNATLDTCPGGGFNLFTLCLAPAFNDPAQPKRFNHSCLKREANDAPFFTPNTADTRVYNRHLRMPNGALVIDAAGNEVAGAWYRVRSAITCRESATLQIGCLAALYGCTLGLGGPSSEWAGGAALAISGVEAKVPNFLNRSYPLAQSFYLNTLKGFGAVTNNSSTGTTTNERNFAECFANPAVLHPAATFAGLIPLNAVNSAQGPKCVDFDETVCQPLPNVNACATNPAPFPR